MSRPGSPTTVPQPNYYCSRDDVRHYLPQSIFAEQDDSDGETDNDVVNWRNPAPPTLTNAEIDFFIQQICQMIDASLATQYDVPLRLVNLGGVVSFPGPIPTIAAILTAQVIFEERLQGADKERSESQKEREQWAEDELARVQNGERRLTGQRSTRSSRTVRTTLYNAPNNPAEGGRSQGSRGS